ncbi:hypothetical protein [Pseudarthrobacter niigatensis]|uniref:Uncharacterized protein n=1 Tax=Pseudarthrobacter niigatensis TaxID=369935 RepID=A0AAJ1WDA3_9MICC|nr:hypothetical protein [Pseudarthrobacter niigatensis]MDQ0145949.1 hypothetical protein [Pseudarthrobacter niigatensis]MDQ0266323.1 hypothetical protein [Pseudarthrobacter niigatensis]
MGTAAAVEDDGAATVADVEGGEELPGVAGGGWQAVARSRTATAGAKRTIRRETENIGLPSPKVVPAQPQLPVQ